MVQYMNPICRLRPTRLKPVKNGTLTATKPLTVQKNMAIEAFAVSESFYRQTGQLDRSYAPSSISNILLCFDHQQAIFRSDSSIARKPAEKLGRIFIPARDPGCPTSRSFFARCGIPRTSTFHWESKACGSRAVVSHISRKTSEMWGTRGTLLR
jgi:hypothetical protein